MEKKKTIHSSDMDQSVYIPVLNLTLLFSLSRRLRQSQRSTSDESLRSFAEKESIEFHTPTTQHTKRNSPPKDFIEQGKRHVCIFLL